jgi:hypothetical protein
VTRWTEATRLPAGTGRTRIDAGEPVHATRDALADQRALCEVDGPTVTDGIVLDLSDPDAPAYVPSITCPDCLTWMHA